jgi:hypothetical protein
MHFNILHILAIGAATLPALTRANPPYYNLEVLVQGGKVSINGGCFSASTAVTPYLNADHIWSGWDTVCCLVTGTPVVGVMSFPGCSYAVSFDTGSGTVKINGAVVGKTLSTIMPDGSVYDYGWANENFAEIS